MENITPEVMLRKHVLKKGSALSCSSTVIISGMNDSEKTNLIEMLLANAVTKKDKAQQQCLPVHGNPKCLHCYKVVIFGEETSKNVTWLPSNDISDDVSMCLMSYFANLCKIREQGHAQEYPRLLEFAPLPTMSENIDPQITELIRNLYVELLKQWDRVKTDINVRAVAPEGISLVNIFNVGSSQAGRDFLPFLNKYCQKATNIHVACYNSKRDGEELLKETGNNGHYQAKRKQLLRQVCGIGTDQILILADTNPDNAPPNWDSETLVESIRKATSIKQIEHMHASYKTMDEVKSDLENKVIEKSLREQTLLYYMLLYIVRSKCASFWMRRREIESLSKLLQFTKKDLEDFLLFHAGYGSIFYAHDIPSLREYIIIDIVKFVEHIDKLYESSEETAQFGLFKSEGERRIILEFLATLGIAAVVKSNQLVWDGKLKLDDLTTYYYIPTARKSCMLPTKPTGQTQDDVPTLPKLTVPLISVKGHANEVLQVCLCKLLLNKQCLLIPSNKMNTTAMRFHDLHQQGTVDIVFIDSGNTIFIESNDIDPTIIVQKIHDIIISTETIFTRQEIIDSLTSKTLQGKNHYTKFLIIINITCFFFQLDSESKPIQPEKAVAIAKKILQHNDLTNLPDKLKVSDEWLETYSNGDMTETEQCMCMIMNYSKKVNRLEFRNMMQELGVAYD